MPSKLQTQFGQVSIADEIFATIAGFSALENYGVIGMASKNAKDGLWEILRRDNVKKGVQISIVDEELVIDLYIMVEYGVSISAVAENVIHNVGYHVFEMTGVKVKAVNVHVEGVRVQQN